MSQDDLKTFEVQDPSEYGKKKTPIVFFFILIAIHIAVSLITPFIARSEGAVPLFGAMVPVNAFTGVSSSIGNICLLFMVVFYKKPGFVTAVIMMFIQTPSMMINVFLRHAVSGIPGIFTNLLTLISLILIYQRNKQIEKYSAREVRHLTDRQRASLRLFEQTVTALVNAVDAKDTYSHGHSIRVAEYSEKIARRLDKDEDECRRIYFAALLHDVGKIGIPNHIINKKGKLDPEEFDLIKQHTTKGNMILSSISEYPYLSIGAHFHHERYDGKGYPIGLKGEDIPEIARIISVADAYDAMTSNRSYRDAIPQQLVREELVKGAGTQFDPAIVEEMLHMIDFDPEYRMREKTAVEELAGRSELVFGEYGTEASDGIILSNRPVTIKLKYTYDIAKAETGRGPALLMFDSLDGRVHRDERMIHDMVYYEYADIFLRGDVVNKGTRKVETRVKVLDPEVRPDEEDFTFIAVEAVKIKDHVLIKISDSEKETEITFALPDSSRYTYLALTGEHCKIFDVSIETAEYPVQDGYIRRIAEEISYIKDRPEGNIPNIQINGHRTDHTPGIKLKDVMEISFHTMSLPTARLVWHCPYFIVYHSKDGKVYGDDYREYAFIRMDGENLITDGASENTITVNKTEAFKGWDAWKEENKHGIDGRVRIVKEDNTVIVTAENLGLAFKDTTIIRDEVQDIYVALSGDQCAITNIRYND